MIYKNLWLAAALIGAANFLLFTVDQSLVCGLAAVVCTISCVITYKDAWSGR